MCIFIAIVSEFQERTRFSSGPALAGIYHSSSPLINVLLLPFVGSDAVLTVSGLPLSERCRQHSAGIPLIIPTGAEIDNFTE